MTVYKRICNIDETLEQLREIAAQMKNAREHRLTRMQEIDGCCWRVTKAITDLREKIGPAALAAARPLVTVQSLDGDMAVDSSAASLPLHDVLKSSIRLDIVRFVHNNLSKNGHQTSAESWGTVRAVSRIPRVNTNQRRFSFASALAASAVPSLVLTCGHHIESVPELPLVVSDSAESLEKTSAAIKLLKSIGAYPGAVKAKNSHAVRPGKGKMNNRRYVSRKGPVIFYGTVGSKIVKAFRNIPGMEICHVDRFFLQLSKDLTRPQQFKWDVRPFLQLKIPPGK